MTDIVERLREQPTMSVFANIGDMVGRLNHEREEAADEIERLRAALRGIACTDDTCECGYVEGEGPFCELGRARTALGEKE